MPPRYIVFCHILVSLSSQRVMLCFVIFFPQDGTKTLSWVRTCPTNDLTVYQSPNSWCSCLQNTAPGQKLDTWEISAAAVKKHRGPPSEYGKYQNVSSIRSVLCRFLSKNLYGSRYRGKPQRCSESREENYKGNRPPRNSFQKATKR